MASPLVVITVPDPGRRGHPDRFAPYAEAIARQGGRVQLLAAGTATAERRAALTAMDGLLLPGGADIDPSRYGQAPDGARDGDPERDALEAEAWAVAGSRAIPVLGICRGFQAINVLSGGRLLQHVDGHRGAAWGTGPALTHPIRIAPGTRLARILFPTNTRGGVLEVNSYHHQAVRPADLGPDLVASATASSPAGEIVEGLETRAGRFVLGVQCHPERRESTPPGFERLFRVFVDACRGPQAARADARAFPAADR